MYITLLDVGLFTTGLELPVQTPVDAEPPKRPFKLIGVLEHETKSIPAFAVAGGSTASTRVSVTAGHGPSGSFEVKTILM